MPKIEPEFIPPAKTTLPPSGCCGGAAPLSADACCVQDAEAKAAGRAGCGCGAPPRTEAAHE